MTLDHALTRNLQVAQQINLSSDYNVTHVSMSSLN